MPRRDQLTRLRESSPAILPSLLLCDFGNLEREIRALEQAGVAGLHLDVMDGVFVPNLSYGLPIVEACRRLTELPLDVHLMIAQPENYVRQFSDVGADIITVHAEAVEDPADLLQRIRELGVASGLAINPPTTVESVQHCLPWCDLFLVMSVQAGFGGQSFRPEVLPKLQQARQASEGQLVLEIDGGVNAATIAQCAQAGADLFVAGSAIFGHEDYAAAVEEMSQKIFANRN